MTREANQTFPSFNGDIAGIYSAGVAAAQNDHLPNPAYWWTILEASIAATGRFSILKKYPVEYMTCLLSVPRALGGWPIILFTNFAIRSVQDQLTSSLHMWRTLMMCSIHRPHILRIATTRMKVSDPSMLIKDPQALPLIIPKQPENYVKSKIAEVLPKMIRKKNNFCTWGGRNKETLSRWSLVHKAM